MANHHRDLGKEQFWREALTRWQRSGRSVRDFCFGESLSQSSFYQWRRELERRKGERRVPKFVPVRVVGEDHRVGHEPALEIVFPEGHRIRVGIDCPVQTLAAVLDVLEARRC
jgi:transposase